MTSIIVGKRHSEDSGKPEDADHEMHLTPDGNVDRVRQRFNWRAVTDIPEQRVMKESFMKKLALGLLIVLVAACGGKKDQVIIIDSSNGGGSDSGTADACNVLAQTGCATGQKCSWIHDATTPVPLGHVGCAPNGTAAVGGTCMYGPDGAMGFDDCLGGSVCQSGRCKMICDPAGVAPNCATGFGCSTYEGLFGPAGQPVSGGVCDPSCNPLDDNDFDGSAGPIVKPGSACPAGGSQVLGCYGYPSSAHPTRWNCTREVPGHDAIVHRVLCTTMNGCANSAGTAFLNGCAQGYIPLLRDMTGGTGVVCVAICKPGNTYLNNPGTQAPVGLAPHQCNNSFARGTFNNISNNVSNDGDHCLFSWFFEIDMMNVFLRSPTSDTVGFCVDHSKYKYDSNGDGMVTSADAAWPLCSSLPDGNGSAAQRGAADFGCVDTTHAGLPFTGKGQVRRPLMELPRPMYHAVAQ